VSAREHDLDIPEGLAEPGRRAYEIIVAHLKERGFSDNGTCKAFYAPAEWAAREEAYGTKSHLVVVYDGGAIRPVFSMDAAYDLDCAMYQETGKKREPYQLYEGMQKELRAAGFYFEECTRWYSAVYSVDSAVSDAEDDA
jgi:hypothetical protein